MKKWERIREISRKNRDSIDFVLTDIYNMNKILQNYEKEKNEEE